MMEMKNYEIGNNLYRKDAIDFLCSKGCIRKKLLNMSEDSLLVTYDAVKRQERKLRWYMMDKKIEIQSWRKNGKGGLVNESR